MIPTIRLDGNPMKRTFWRRPPLFLRIFSVMLLAVLGAQILNFALLLTLRLPEPHVYPLADVAAALRSGGDGLALQTVHQADAPIPGDVRDRQLGALLASQLGVPADRVRVRLVRSLWLPAHRNAIRTRTLLLGAANTSLDVVQIGRAVLIVGGFEAAVRSPDGSWQVAKPAAQGIEPWQWKALFWLTGPALLLMPLAWLMARRIAAPVDLFARAAERLGRNPRAPPMKLEGPPEIAAAAEAFNAMQARLQRYVDDRTTMIAAIAHDLRTPLMRLNVLLDDVPPATRSAAEAEIREMRQRISSIIAFMRDMAKASQRPKLNLRSLVESVAEEMADDGADVSLADGPDVAIEADVGAVRSLLINLIENAVCYAGNARISLECVDGFARIAIADTGPGVPAAELELVFHAFYRVEGSRNRETGGTGLGLASARAVARAHGGDVVLSNRPEGGLLALVSLPA